MALVAATLTNNIRAGLFLGLPFALARVLRRSLTLLADSLEVPGLATFVALLVGELAILLDVAHLAAATARHSRNRRNVRRPRATSICLAAHRLQVPNLAADAALTVPELALCFLVASLAATLAPSLLSPSLCLLANSLQVANLAAQAALLFEELALLFLVAGLATAQARVRHHWAFKVWTGWSQAHFPARHTACLNSGP
mmetsp:Transcript_10748/g.27751  ORF Transcript_10748/g.27751 Transcript_10748/m.27751 type:complete len:200 (-) Transcript_10748:14-613(-)